MIIERFLLPKKPNMPQQVQINKEDIALLKSKIKDAYNTQQELAEDATTIAITETTATSDTKTGFLLSKNGNLFNIVANTGSELYIDFWANILGPQGATGATGATGPRGVSGARGLPALEVKEFITTKYNAGDYIDILFDRLNRGVIQDDLYSFVPIYALINENGVNKSYIYYTTIERIIDDGQLLSARFRISAVIDTTGATGATGATGPQGPVGPQGPAGGGAAPLASLDLVVADPTSITADAEDGITVESQGTATDTNSVTYNINVKNKIPLVGSETITIDVNEDNKVEAHIDAEISAKIARSLVTPASMPDSTKIVAIDTNGSQTNLTVGDGLLVQNGTLSAPSSGGGGSGLVKYEPTEVLDFNTKLLEVLTNGTFSHFELEFKADLATRQTGFRVSNNTVTNFANEEFTLFVSTGAKVIVNNIIWWDNSYFFIIPATTTSNIELSCNGGFTLGYIAVDARLFEFNEGSSRLAKLNTNMDDNNIKCTLYYRG